MTQKRKVCVSESRETMFSPVYIYGEFPDLSIGFWRKEGRCRLDIYIRNASDTLKWRWFSPFSRNYVFSYFGMVFSNGIWWRHQYDSSTFTSESWTSAPIVITPSRENTYNLHSTQENADLGNELKFARILK